MKSSALFSIFLRGFPFKPLTVTANRRLSVDFQARYVEEKQKATVVEKRQNLTPVDPRAIFANNELPLAQIDAYGFDYDYTIAQYSNELHSVVYDRAKEILVKENNFPSEILGLPYEPGFAIRGLHHHIEKNVLMKLDMFLNIQGGTVYSGRTPLKNEKVFEVLEGNYVSTSDLSAISGKNGKARQLVDQFAVPEMTLLADCTQYMMDNEIPYDSEYLASDIKYAISKVHLNNYMYETILSDKEKYILRSPRTVDLLNWLKSSGKHLFIITNSKFTFVNEGMNFLVGEDWRDLFDVIIVKARKPEFYNDDDKPFRPQEPTGDTPTWRRISRFEPGGVYQEGNVYQFTALTGWRGANVLYFGDHVYSDLADAILKIGWRTGAIIPELEDEINTSNSLAYTKKVFWLLSLQTLIEDLQIFSQGEPSSLMQSWLEERDTLRHDLKTMFNPQFGSIFRTHQNPTYFSRRLSRFADIYTSSIDNLLQYSLKHTFYPRRAALPHEIVMAH
eukprot:m.248090 g.248090  ORF g.248090 m.248090 type:complete len:504 (+) comp40281_c1_seq20:515-2026(+)